MKKQFVFSMMAAAAFLLAACNSNDDVKGESPYGPTGEGYVSFNIMLPTTPNTSTRANDDWDDGLQKEYKVNDAILVIFAGPANVADNNENIKFMSAYNLNASPFALVGSTDDGCTTEARLTTMLQQTEEQADNEIYAYVILNGSSVFTVNETNNKLTVLKADGTNVTLGPNDATFAQFTVYELAAAMIGDPDAATGMLMTSAPNSDKQGGNVDPTGAKVTALAKLDKSKIYNTPEMARSNPAADVYVGRSAVKVEVTTNFPTTTTIEGNTAVTYDASSFVWTLGNTNKTFFIGRQFDSNWLGLFAPGAPQEAAPGDDYKYRFVGYTAIHSGVWRTYWGIDPNYAVDNTGGTFDNEVPEETAYVKKSGDVMYTTENTMSEDYITHNNTTYVAVGVELNKGKKFYTVPNTTGDDAIYDEDGIKDYVRELFAVMDEYRQFKQAVYDGSDPHTEISVNNITVTLNEDDLENVGVTLAYDNSVAISTETEAKFTALQTAFAAMMADTKTFINVYPLGMAYYYVPIEHFSSVETPWDAANKQSAQYDHTYPVTNRAAYYLGRWGVLRNNWYKLEVTGIRHIGKPKPVEPGTEPDDEVDKYISVKIHVMPWTIRTQSNYKL